MKHRLHWIFAPYMKPAGEDGSDTGGGGGGDDKKVDRGDDFTPTEDDEDEAKAAIAKAAAEKAAAAAKDSKDVDPDDPDGALAKAAADKKAAEDKKAADEADKKGDKNIPVSRHKAILDKEREAREEAEKKLAKYEGGDRIKVVNAEITAAEKKIDGLQAEYDKAIIDGDAKAAAEKMKEIRALDKQVSEQKVDLAARAAVSEATERMRYDLAIDRLEAAYPVLDPKHDDHDPEIAQDVLDLSLTYQRRGSTPTEAVQKAAKKLLGIETAKQEAATVVKPKVDKDDAEKLAEKAEEERRKAAVEKNVKTAAKQPADTSKVGADSDKAGGSITSKDVVKMNFKDFSALDEETLARMRGDVLA